MLIIFHQPSCIKATTAKSQKICTWGLVKNFLLLGTKSKSSLYQSSGGIGSILKSANQIFIKAKACQKPAIAGLVRPMLFQYNEKIICKKIHKTANKILLAGQAKATNASSLIGFLK